MRITRRHEHVDAYWAKRWAAIPADEAAANPEAYPLRYALEAMRGVSGPVLEAGCGSGRILRRFHEQGARIIGMDYVAPGLVKLAQAAPGLKLIQGDMRRLPFAEGTFQCVLAFGLYHGIEHGMEQALAETLRVLAPGGALCASFRTDNVQNRLIDWYADRQAGQKTGGAPAAQPAQFHKLNLTRREYEDLLTRAGFVVERTWAAQNYPFFYKFPVFRAREQASFDESRGRRDGYRLNLAGRMLQNGMYALAPYQMCNVTVCLTRKPAKPAKERA